MQRQLALKILIIFVVGLMLIIPISMVENKVRERGTYQEQAKSAVEQSWTGSQRVFSPVLVIPYQLSPLSQSGFVYEKDTPSLNRVLVVTPDEVDVNADVKTQALLKGIYKVPVYNSDIQLNGQFSEAKLLDEVTAIKQQPRFAEFGVPYLTVHIRDVRGLDKAPVLVINERKVEVQPGSSIDALPAGIHVALPQLLNSIKALQFKCRLFLRGTETLSFVPLADSVSSMMHSDWPHPEFIGSLLPTDRDISADGFSANWFTTKYSNSSGIQVARCVTNKACDELMRSSHGVRFIEPVDVYLQSERAVKYAMLFIGLSFITFFIFEHLKAIRIHPIQYAFVGLAIAVFYLLLVSLAEHIAFAWAYCIGVLCCSGLLLFYVRYMLHSLRSALLFFGMLVGLYGLLYVIIQAEDFALLMGSVLVFCVLSTLMTVTRKIDWYQFSDRAVVSSDRNLELDV